VAVAHGFTLPFILNHYPRKLETVLQTLGVFNVLLLMCVGCVGIQIEGGANSKV
jgi:hypothetical protein